MKKILVIAAHPDDEIYGMGGTIAKLAAEGNEVHVLIVTDGSTAQYRGRADLAEILLRKKQETSKALACVGAATCHYGNLPDMRLDTVAHIKINEVIESVIDEISPEIVYTHFWGDVNLDHQKVFESTLVATRPTASQTVRELYCYSVPSSTEWQPAARISFTPNTFVDISAYTAQKTAAIEAYATELRPYPHPRSAQAVQVQDTAKGLQVGLSAAEEFILLRSVQV